MSTHHTILCLPLLSYNVQIFGQTTVRYTSNWSTREYINETFKPTHYDRWPIVGRCSGPPNMNTLHQQSHGVCVCMCVCTLVTMLEHCQGSWWLKGKQTNKQGYQTAPSHQLVRLRYIIHTPDSLPRVWCICVCVCVCVCVCGEQFTRFNLPLHQAGAIVAPDKARCGAFYRTV